jgi:hypothetical protein
MEGYELNRFEELMAQGECSKGFACFSSSVRDLCSGNYDPETSQVECLKCKSQSCDFIVPCATGTVCTCPLRNYIVKNFDQWIADSVHRMKSLS